MPILAASAAVLTGGVAIPARVPPGFTLAARSAVITPSAFELGLPCVFSVR